jgi:hypothetical protein
MKEKRVYVVSAVDKTVLSAVGHLLAGSAPAEVSASAGQGTAGSDYADSKDNEVEDSVWNGEY